jgi:hypothetical protein
VDSVYLTHRLATVVTIYNDRRLFSKALDLSANGNEAGSPGCVKTDVLIEIMIVKTRHRRLEDMRRRASSLRDSPAAVPVEQCRLRLSTSKAELASEGPA